MECRAAKMVAKMSHISGNNQLDQMAFVTHR